MISWRRISPLPVRKGPAVFWSLSHQYISHLIRIQLQSAYIVLQLRVSRRKLLLQLFELLLTVFQRRLDLLQSSFEVLLLAFQLGVALISLLSFRVVVGFGLVGAGLEGVVFFAELVIRVLDTL